MERVPEVLELFDDVEDALECDALCREPYDRADPIEEEVDLRRILGRDECLEELLWRCGLVW